MSQTGAQSPVQSWLINQAPVILKRRVTALPFQFRTDIARTEYLSNADERLRWQASSLPADDLCTENAIMLKRFNRYILSAERAA